MLYVSQNAQVHTVRKVSCTLWEKLSQNLTTLAKDPYVCFWNKSLSLYHLPLIYFQGERMLSPLFS